MWRAIAFSRFGWPLARWYWRTIFQAASTDSEPPEVKKMRSIPGGARSARRSARASAAGWAVPHSVLKASLESCSPATVAISSP